MPRTKGEPMETISVRLPVNVVAIGKRRAIKHNGGNLSEYFRDIIVWRMTRIHRRRDLANEDATMWRQLTDRGLKEGTLKQSTDSRKA